MSICAKAKGSALGEETPNADTVEKIRLRSGAADVPNILKNRRSDYGIGPEKALPADVVECAKLGRSFLHLSSTVEHYATKKFLRAELMRGRKARAGPDPQ